MSLETKQIVQAMNRSNFRQSATNDRMIEVIDKLMDSLDQVIGANSRLVARVTELERIQGTPTPDWVVRATNLNTGRRIR